MLRTAALVVVIVVAGLEALYVVGANIVLATGLLEHLANQRPEILHLTYRRAFTPWPGRVYARDFALRFQDPNVAFELTMATSRVDVALTELFSRKFCAKHARGTGVSYRMLLKVDSVQGMEERVLAFPPIAGVALPPLRTAPAPEDALTAEEIDRLWSVEFHDVDSELSELWLFEYRYQGRGHSHGAFGIVPLKQVWVGPANLSLVEGTLSVGPYVLSERFSLKSEATLAPFDISTPPGLEMLEAITGTVGLRFPLASLEFGRVYLPGATVHGSGTLTAEVHLKAGKLEVPTVLDAELPDVRAGFRGFGFAGGISGGLAVGDQPVVRAIAAGSLTVPVPGQTPLIVAVDRLAGALALASSDLSEGVDLGWLHAGIEKAQAADARPVVALATAKVLFFAPQLFGDGPLTASGSIDINRHQTVVRIGSARLGSASLRGAAALRGNTWSGAAAGHAASFSIGIHLVDGVPLIWPFVPEGWLDEKLAADRIDFPLLTAQ